jgi:hypothetical protein
VTQPQGASPDLNMRHGRVGYDRNAGAIHMADTRHKHRPAPESGYREQHDPRGQPGQDQKKDGRQLPENADQRKPKPQEPEQGPARRKPTSKPTD